MEQKRTIGSLAKEKEDILITRENLLEEIKTALQDEFIAEITARSKGLELKFLNGQVFFISVN